jgi:hypothetical protein
MKSKIISIVLVGMLMLSSAAFMNLTKAGPSDVTFSLSPSSSTFYSDTTHVGDKFTVIAMWTDSGSPLNGVFAWQVRLVVNSSWLKISNAKQLKTDPNFLLAEAEAVGNTTYPAASGVGTNDVTIMGSVQGAGPLCYHASAVMASFEIEITAAPGKHQTLTSSLEMNWIDDTIWSPDGNTWYHPTCQAGSAQYIWAIPPNPHLEVTPALTTYGPLPPAAVGEEFDVQVYLRALDAGWGFYNATFTLTYDCATPPPTEIIENAGYTVDPYWTTSGVDNSTVGTINVWVTKTPSPVASGDYLIITIRFRVIYQGIYLEDDEAPLTLSDIALYDADGVAITTDPAVNGDVWVYGALTLPLCHLQVDDTNISDFTQPFNVTVSMKGLDANWFFIGLDFRMDYDPAVVMPLAAYEGPFLPYYASLQPGNTMGTWWYGQFQLDSGYPPHALVGNVIYPNDTGRWNRPFPEGDGVIAIFTFQFTQAVTSLDYQTEGATMFHIIEEDLVGIDNPDGAQNIVDVPHSDPINGTAHYVTGLPGRFIDIYVGQDCTPYPAPYGGQGKNKPADLFWPQKEVCIWADVKYNYWPVQQKDVAFEIRDNHGSIWDIVSARTNASGIAEYCFRIPWPCDNPEQYFGVWTITASVDLACIVINDTLQFHFDYKVEIFKVTTDKTEYNHGDCFDVTILYGSHAQQSYPVVFYAVLKDELGVPVWYGWVETTIGGQEHFCRYLNGTVTIRLCIPKFAFAGIAHIYVTAFDALPTEGGSAIAPTYGLVNPFGYAWPPGSTLPAIIIKPF